MLTIYLLFHPLKMPKKTTSPAKKTYCVWADCIRRVCQQVEATNPKEANRIAPTSAHTPGPWVLRPNGHIKAQADVGKWDDYICAMPFSSMEEALEMSTKQLANAKLIAAAPRLLDVLKQAYAACSDGSITDTGSCITIEMQRAIASASGEAP